MITFLITLLVLFYIFIVFKRYRRYKYDTSKDYLYDLSSHLLMQTELKSNKLSISDRYKDYDTLIAQITLKKDISSYFFKPYIEIESVKYFFEYGAIGMRYIVLDASKREFDFTPHNLTLKDNSVKLYAYSSDISLEDDSILIFAPHADDAEIAAFGLYKEAKNITIVTTTAGEHGLCNYCDIYNQDRVKNALKKAELRAYDALSIPLLGGVDIQNSLALGYFGGTLKEMSERAKEVFVSKVDGITDMRNFRRVNHSHIKLKENVEASYSFFMQDLQDIISEIKPTLIITPHPDIDSHIDHKQTTYSVIEALESLNHTAKLMLYTNHLQLSETYPIGEISSAVNLPPNMKDFYFDSIYSFALNKDLQSDKYFALEAIHDLRDSSLVISIKSSYRHLKKLIKRKIFGKDKSYFKRAVRANELFFILESENIKKLYPSKS
jgi:LmbE family N-acetylglucosaminyl deacetylase